MGLYIVFPFIIMLLIDKYKTVMSLEPNFVDDYDYQYNGTFGEMDRSRIYIVKHIGDGNF